jgi:glucose/mannose-6-phosphate isomerase
MWRKWLAETSVARITDEMPIRQLDDEATLRAIDRGGMLQKTYALSEQIEEAFSLVDRFPPLPSLDFDRILLCGTGGGSRAAIDLLQSYLSDQLPTPLSVYQGYGLPSSANAKTLILIVSYSGNTEEQLSSLQQAINISQNVLLITGGGQMQALAAQSGLYTARVPTGMEARAAIGFLFFSLLSVLGRALQLNLPLPSERSDLLYHLRSERDLLDASSPTVQNPAKQVAEKILGRIPFIYGSYGFSDALAERLRRQLAENGKTLAHSNRIPDFHHDEIVGYENAELQNTVLPIFLRDFQEDPRIVKRYLVTREILEGKGFAVLELYPLHRGGKLARLFSLLQLIDFVSLYVALAKEIDPANVSIIQQFKERMAQ